LAKVTVVQTQVKESQNGSKNERFDLKIPIAFGYTDADSPLKTFKVRIHEREQSFYFPLEKKPQFISFDAGNNYLKTVTLEYPLAELKAQLKYDPDPVSRIYAAQALVKKGGLEVVQALAEALTDDPFWGVRVEVAKQLAKVKLDQASVALVAGLQDKDARVRRSVVEALSKVKTVESYQALNHLLEGGDASYYVEASAAKVLGKLASGSMKDKADEVLHLLTTILNERAGWNEVVRSGAIAGLSQMKSSPQALDVIMEYTKLGVPQPLRLASIRALGTISTGQTPNKLEEILEALEELSGESFFLTQVAVVSALAQMETVKAIGVLRSLCDQTPDGRVRRRAEEAMQKVQKQVGSDKAIKQLREELDQIKQENQELKSRLESLEAKSS
jgi:aminopeptidase N